MLIIIEKIINLYVVIKTKLLQFKNVCNKNFLAKKIILCTKQVI